MGLGDLEDKEDCDGDATSSPCMKHGKGGGEVDKMMVTATVIMVCICCCCCCCCVVIACGGWMRWVRVVWWHHY